VCSVDLVEAVFVATEKGQAVARRRLGDHAVTSDLGVVAHPPQQAIGDAGCSPSPSGDLAGTRRVEAHAEDTGGPQHDALQVGRRVEVKAGHESESVAEGTGDEPGARGGTDQREARNVEADGSRRRTLADDD